MKFRIHWGQNLAAGLKSMKFQVLGLEDPLTGADEHEISHTLGQNPRPVWMSMKFRIHWGSESRGRVVEEHEISGTWA